MSGQSECCPVVRYNKETKEGLLLFKNSKACLRQVIHQLTWCLLLLVEENDTDKNDNSYLLLQIDLINNNVNLTNLQGTARHPEGGLLLWMCPPASCLWRWTTKYIFELYHPKCSISKNRRESPHSLLTQQIERNERNPQMNWERNWIFVVTPMNNWHFCSEDNLHD